MAAPSGIKRAAKWLAGIAAILLLLGCTGLFFPTQAVFYACLGWIGFLWRVVPQIAVNWSGVATAAVCLVGVLAGGHWFLNWLYVSSPHRADSPRVWQPRWTIGVVASVILMFTSGICFVGIAHQTAWLATSKEPIIESSFKHLIHRIQSHDNLKQIGLGIGNYHDLHHALPAGVVFDDRGRPLHGWQTSILPFIEQKELYDRIDRSLPWNAPENKAAFSQHVPAYAHPGLEPQVDDRGYALSGYAGNAYVLGGSRPWKLEEITDGMSKTIVCGEAATRPRPWGDPVNWRDPALGLGCTPDSFGGPSEFGTNVVFADGHVTYLSNEIDRAVFQALCTPAAGDASKLTFSNY
jgi:prepilin-type processing-associated H-X9-DG protein